MERLAKKQCGTSVILFKDKHMRGWKQKADPSGLESKRKMRMIETGVENTGLIPLAIKIKRMSVSRGGFETGLLSSWVESGMFRSWKKSHICRMVRPRLKLNVDLFLRCQIKCVMS